MGLCAETGGDFLDGERDFEPPQNVVYDVRFNGVGYAEGPHVETRLVGVH
jgi:hypothetical protein